MKWKFFTWIWLNRKPMIDERKLDDYEIELKRYNLLDIRLHNKVSWRQGDREELLAELDKCYSERRRITTILKDNDRKPPLFW